MGTQVIALCDVQDINASNLEKMLILIILDPSLTHLDAEVLNMGVLRVMKEYQFGFLFCR